MPQTVEIPGQGIAEFPDEMSPDDIKGVIQNKFYGANAPSLPTQEIQPKMGLADMLFDPETAQNLRAGIQDVVFGLPQMAADLPKFAYEGVKFATGGPQEQAKVGIEALTNAKIQGQQMASDVQSPLGTRESFRGLLNVGMMAAPALGELAGEFALGGRKPPIQSDLPITDSAIQATPQIPEGQITDTVTQQPKIGGELNAVQEPSTGEVLQRQPQEVGETGSGRTGVEQSVQGQETPQASTQEVANVPSEQPRPEPQIQPTFSVQSPTDVFGSEHTPISSYLINDVGGVVSKSAASKSGKLEGNADLWDDVQNLSHPTHNKIYNPNGELPDNAAQELYNAGLIPDPSPTTMWQALADESKSTRSILEGQKGQVSDIKKQAGQAKDFSEAQHDSWKQGEPTVQVRDLQVGDTVTVKGESLKVTDIDPDTFDVTLEDGKKYGVQSVKDNTVIYGEHETVKHTPVSELTDTTTAQPLPKTEGESPLVSEVNEGLAAGEQPPVSTKNAYTEAQRAARGFPEAEQAAKRDFGTVWDEAAAQAQEDPGIGRRLVDELNNKPREVSDTENAHLLRTQIETQTEHSAAVDAVNNAKTPEDLAAAKSRLELARNDLQDVYDATKRAGTKSGQALAARQMLSKEDYTLASMEARRRAANNGVPLNENQLSETKALHEKIADLQSKLDAHEVAQKFNAEFSRLVNEAKKDAKASKATTKFNDFMDRKADEARARIVERRGRLTTGFDPSSIADEAIIGASHIAKGITKFADWSVKMVDEFGDAVRPFLKDIWEKSKAFHAQTAGEYGEKALARYKTYLGKQTEQIKGKIEAGDFTKAERQRTKLDAEAFTMRANLQKLKNEFERGVAKEAYQKKSPAQKFWDHFVGVERAMKLSGPEVFGKLGVAAAVREAVLAPAESAVGYGASKLFPRLTAGTKYGADLSTVIRAELKAKAALFTKGIQDAAQNVKGKESELDAIAGKKIRPDFWYNRIGQMHAAIKAPVKRAEFTRSLEQRMDAAVKNGEDIHHPEVMTRLANEAVMDANRAIFQQNTIVSNFFSMVDKKFPTGGRVARFFFPVVKIPVNLFKELVTYHAGAPVAAGRIGMAYWKGIEATEPAVREAIIRQLTKGSVGGAALIYGYTNSEKVRDLFKNAPQWFNHTPIAMALNEGSYLKKLQGTDAEKKEGQKELAYMAKTDIPFMYSVKDVTDALDTHNSHALLGWINNMVQSTTVPQISTQVAKATDKPGTFPSNLSQRPNYRVARNPVEAVKLGVPGLRQQVPQKGGGVTYR